MNRRYFKTGKLRGDVVDCFHIIGSVNNRSFLLALQLAGDLVFHIFGLAVCDNKRSAELRRGNYQG